MYQNSISTRNEVVQLIIPFYLLIFFQCCFAVPSSAAEPGQDNATKPYDVLRGEKLWYDIDFWLFSKAARGSMTFEKHLNGYRAVFEAETCGVIKALTGHRKEVMESVMEYDREKKKLRPLLFQETFSQGDREIKKSLSFDYAQQTFTLTRERNKEKISSMTRKLPVREFDDLLTFFFNLRTGHYGAAQEGKKFSVCVLAKEKPSNISVDFPVTDRRKKSGGKYFAVLSMDKDITQAHSKQVTSWLTPDSIPTSGRVVDAYFFGDLEVTLKKRTFTQSGAAATVTAPASPDTGS
ncbi:MAG: DUF3108 domain-containing protein [Pseudomonadota bacterium]